jgi:membrane protein involved in colicin uptake
MQKIIIYCSLALVILCCPSLSTATDNAGKGEDKSVTKAVADDARAVKKEFKKTKDETREAIVHDIKELRKQIPQSIKEAKKELINKSENVKDATIQELKEIRDGLKKLVKPQ